MGLRMTKRAYGFGVGLVVAAAILTWVASVHYNLPIRDPDGLAGPAYIRLPGIVLLFYLADVLPRTLYNNRGFGSGFWTTFKQYSKERWTRSRIALVSIGLFCFYVAYVAYRNLKGFLPIVRDGHLYDRELDRLDQALMFNHYPADVLHTLLGTGFSAHFLSFVYTGYLLFVPLSLGAALVWSKNVATGFWYVIALCINWLLGAMSYYWVPSLGPFLSKPSLFIDLPHTGVTSLQTALANGRESYLEDAYATSSVQSVAAFASLHVSVVFTAALIAHFVIPNKFVRWSMWVFFVLTTISTIYFGWHYLLDDVAGVLIGLIAVWIGAKATGHPMRVQRDRGLAGDGVIGVFPPESQRPADEPVRSEVHSAPHGASSPRNALRRWSERLRPDSATAAGTPVGGSTGRDTSTDPDDSATAGTPTAPTPGGSD